MRRSCGHEKDNVKMVRPTSGSGKLKESDKQKISEQLQR